MAPEPKAEPMNGATGSNTTSPGRDANLATMAEIAQRAEAAARDLLALAPSPAQRGTVALIALASIEREFARGLAS